MDEDSLRLTGKVAVVSGAGGGLGRAEALALAAAGADVVVNDVGAAAHEVVEQITATGRRAVAVVGDIGERATADAIMTAATEQLGGLHIVVNNAGFLRDRMLFNMSDEDWDAVVRVHLRGHFLLSRNAAGYWRAQSKAAGGPIFGRVVNTVSEAALMGSPGQANYAAAKAGIAALTVSTARGLANYGVRANAICPRARTNMTSAAFGDAPEQGVDPLGVAHVAPLVAFLASPAADAVNGQVFLVYGGMVALLRPASIERRFDTSGDTWTPAELADSLGGYFATRDPARSFSAADVYTLSIPDTETDSVEVSR